MESPTGLLLRDPMVSIHRFAIGSQVEYSRGVYYFYGVCSVVIGAMCNDAECHEL